MASLFLNPPLLVALLSLSPSSPTLLHTRYTKRRRGATSASGGEEPWRTTQRQHLNGLLKETRGDLCFRRRGAVANHSEAAPEWAAEGSSFHTVLVLPPPPVAHICSRMFSFTMRRRGATSASGGEEPWRTTQRQHLKGPLYFLPFPLLPSCVTSFPHTSLHQEETRGELCFRRRGAVANHSEESPEAATTSSEAATTSSEAAGSEDQIRQEQWEAGGRVVLDGGQQITLLPGGLALSAPCCVPRGRAFFFETILAEPGEGEGVERQGGEGHGQEEQVKGGGRVVLDGGQQITLLPGGLALSAPCCVPRGRAFFFETILAEPEKGEGAGVGVERQGGEGVGVGVPGAEGFLRGPANKPQEPEPFVASTEDDTAVDESGRDLRSPDVCTTTTDPSPPEATAPVTEIGAAAGDSATKKRKDSSGSSGKQWWRQPKPSVSGGTRPKARVQDEGSDEEEEEDGLPTVEEMARYPEVAFAIAHKRFKTSWESLFSWLILTRDDVGFRILRCSTCLEHGEEGANTAYGKGGSGGRDMQKGSIRTHQRSTAHQDAHAVLKSKESRKLRQALISEFEGLDRGTHHIITALKTTVHTCKSEAPITSYVGTIKFMAELGVPNLPLDSKGTYFSEGEALKRFAKVLPAMIVLLHDFKHALYEVVTSFKFHFMLFFLADILSVLNELNTKFQKQQVICGVHVVALVDITVVAGEVSLACRTIEVRYVDWEDRFGNDQSPMLCAFLKRHGNSDHREVTVKGVDQNGDAADHKFTLQERKILGHKTGSDYYSCKVVCREFAKACVGRLEFRLEDLKDLAGSKMFRPSCYPDDNTQRMKKCREWLGMLDHMFHHRLFGTPPDCA
ncbi:unnamed protein product [Closterium sp. Naga37s-1]|nr:unnamed protein product [Closterium sp. Naga37s-1]